MKAPTRGTARRWGFRGLLLLSLVGAVLAYAGPLVFELRGQTLLVLTSGSMDPKYPAGSAVVAEPVTPDQLRVGQVITFKETVEGSKYVTHRIVGLKTLPKTDLDGTPLLDDKGAEIPAYYVQTQGDGNLTPDPNLTPVQQVRFLVVDGYPGLGSWLLTFLCESTRVADAGETPLNSSSPHWPCDHSDQDLTHRSWSRPPGPTPA